ncbi:hypothetical protein, partial [Salmonella enterica]|uniref:hypothetical protein n=1 Tax=Salmonella enterica TaxID=28901 RepID=UPI00113261A2
GVGAEIGKRKALLLGSDTLVNHAHLFRHAPLRQVWTFFTDLLLPETSYLEAEDLVDSSYAAGSHNYMIAIQKTVKPMWEVR